MKKVIPLNLVGELVIINLLLLIQLFAHDELADSDIQLFSTVAWFLCTFFTKHYYSNHSPGILNNILNLITLFIFYSLVTYAFLGMFHKNEFPDNRFLIYSLALFLTLLAWRIIVFYFLVKWLIKTNKDK